MTVPDPVAEHARRRGSDAAVVTPGFTWTWLDLDARVSVCAARLRAVAEPLHISGTDTVWGVTVQAPTSPDLVILVLAALRAGIVLVPLSPRWPRPAAGSAQARLGLLRRIAETDRPDVHDLDLISLASLVSVAGATPKSTARSLDPERPFTVVHTSGSTGTPKAALHSVGNHLASARGVIERLDLRPGDRWWLDLPLEHVGGLGVVMRCAVAGAAVALPDRGLGLAENLDALLPTHASLVPTQLGRWLDAGADTSSLRAVLVGGAATPPDLLDRAVAVGVPVCTSWGMTEMTATVTATPPGAGRDALATVGAPLAGREVRTDAPASEPGEVWVRGASRFQGYLGGALGGGVVTPFDAAGWFATGDLGRLDAAGCLTITGRADLQFVSGGENVQPEAIERVLRGVAGVAEAAVVPVPDAAFGARPVAFVRPADGSPEGVALPSALVAALRDAVRAALPGFMVPDAFHAWAGADGLKPDRPALTREAERRASATESP